MEELKMILEETKDGDIKLTMGGLFVTYFHNSYITEDFSTYYLNDKSGNYISNFSKLFTEYIPFEKAVNDANE